MFLCLEKRALGVWWTLLTAFGHVAQAGLKSESFRLGLCLPYAGIIDLYHHIWLFDELEKNLCTLLKYGLIQMPPALTGHDRGGVS